jgi:hypothetical protein
MAEETVTLDLLARLIRNMHGEMAEFRDQLTVQTAILLRLETGQNSIAEQLRAMVRQHQRTDQGLRTLEEDRLR